MARFEEVSAMFWHSIASELHKELSIRWLPVAGLSRLSGLPERTIESILSGLPPRREPKISEILALMFAVGITPVLETFRVDDVDLAMTAYREGASGDDSQLSLIDRINSLNTEVNP